MALELLVTTIVKRMKEANAQAQAQAAERARIVAAARGGRLAPSQPVQVAPPRPAAPAVAAAPAPAAVAFDTSPFSIDAPGGGVPAAPARRYRRDLLADFSAGGLLPAIVLSEALAKPVALRDGPDPRT